MVKKFDEAGVIVNTEKPVHRQFTRSSENIAIVSESVAEDTSFSGINTTAYYGIFSI